MTSKLLWTWSLLSKKHSLFNDPVKHISYNHWNKMCNPFWYFIFHDFSSCFINKTCWLRSFKLIYDAITGFGSLQFEKHYYGTLQLWGLSYSFKFILRRSVIRNMLSKYPKPRVLLTELQTCSLADPFWLLRSLRTKRAWVRRGWIQALSILLKTGSTEIPPVGKAEELWTCVTFIAQSKIKKKKKQRFSKFYPGFLGWKLQYL